MNLKDYIAGLNQFLKENPKMGNKTAVTSGDDEGNTFNDIHYAPSAGHYDGYEFGGDGDVNAVCVN